MKRTVISGIIFLLVLYSQHASAHSEMAGRLIIKDFQNEVYIKAILEKRFLTIALMNEGDCPPKEMLENCGDHYFREHVKLNLNEEAVKLEKLSFYVTQNEVVFSYKLSKTTEDITSIGIKSNYLLKYNSHAILRAQFDVNNISKSFDLDAQRKSIQADLTSNI